MGGASGRRRRRIHQELRHLGETRRWWADACRFIEDDGLETGAHMAFHALRELNSTLLALLAPIADPAAAQANTEACEKLEKLLGEADFGDSVIDAAKGALAPGGNAKIRAICKLLGLDASIEKAWINLKPHGKAHRRNLGMRAITDRAVIAGFADAE